MGKTHNVERKKMNKHWKIIAIWPSHQYRINEDNVYMYRCMQSIEL